MYLVTHTPTPRLVPDLSDAEVSAFVLAEPRRRVDGRPWVSCNMVTSLDGAATVDGLSGALGGPGDKLVFSTLRASADVIVAGSSTVIAEQYRLPRVVTDERADWRTAMGMMERPRLCIVTSKGHVEAATRLLDELPKPATLDPLLRPIIATTDDAPTADDRFDYLHCGPDRVNPTLLVDQLGALGLTRVLCEGGPTLLGQFAADDLIDEWNFTVAAAAVGGNAIRPMVSICEQIHTLILDRTLTHDDGTLFLRYLRRSDVGTAPDES